MDHKSKSDFWKQLESQSLSLGTWGSFYLFYFAWDEGNETRIFHFQTIHPSQEIVQFVKFLQFVIGAFAVYYSLVYGSSSGQRRSLFLETWMTKYSDQIWILWGFHSNFLSSKKTLDRHWFWSTCDFLFVNFIPDTIIGVSALYSPKSHNQKDVTKNDR